MTTYTKATPAVREYQKLSSLINRRIDESSSLDATRFWLNLYHERGTEIADRYSMTVPDLVDAWIAWCDAIDAEREQARQGVAA